MRLDIFRNDDWVAIYVNEDLKYEGHSLDNLEAIKVIFNAGQVNSFYPHGIFTHYIDTPDMEILGEYPQSMKDIYEEGIKVIE